MFSHRFILLFCVVLFLGLFWFGEPVAALEGVVELYDQQNAAFTGERGANFGEVKDPRLVVAAVIQVFLSLLTIAFVAYAVYGGFLIMRSAGNDDAVKRGKDTIVYATIGVLVVLSAFAITRYVNRILLYSTGLHDCSDNNCVIIEDDERLQRDPLGPAPTRGTL